MPQFYRVLKADPLDGEYTPDKPNAKPLKSFWCQVEGVDEPVMMTKQVPNSPSLTEGHYGVLEQRVSGKGNKYWKFIGMQMPQGERKPHYDGSVATESASPAPAAPHPSNQADIPLWFAPFGIMLKEIYDYVQERKGTPLTQHDVLTEAAKDEPVKTEGIGGGNISKDELEEIFGGPMADPVDLVDRDE